MNVRMKREIELALASNPMFSSTLEQMCHQHYSVMEEVADTLEEWKDTFSVAVTKKCLSQMGYTDVEISDGARLRRDRSTEARLDVATATFEQLMAHECGLSEFTFDSTNVEYEAAE